MSECQILECSPVWGLDQSLEGTWTKCPAWIFDKNFDAGQISGVFSWPLNVGSKGLGPQLICSVFNVELN